MLHAGRAEGVRLWEMARRRAGSPGARALSKFTGDLTFGKTVTVRVCDIDRYKRTVAEIILPDGRHLNQELMRS